MEIKNNKQRKINKLGTKKLISIVCLSFFTICCIIAMILVFVFCKK